MGYVRLDLVDLAIGAGMVLISALVTVLQRFEVLRELIWGTLRAALQLGGVGFVLTAVFALDHPGPVLAVMAMMTLVAAHTARQRVKQPLRGRFSVAAISIAAGSAVSLGYTLFLVVRPAPWFAPRYVVPLAGIIIAFSMNGVALAMDRLTAELVARRPEVEGLLALGATPRRAAKGAMDVALRTAWLPVLNHLMVVGVVQLPGMMTGQIIAGASPLDAVRYQLLVSFMLTVTVAVSAAVAVELVFRRSFSERAQLLSAPERPRSGP